MKYKILLATLVAFTLTSCDAYFDRAISPATIVTDNWSSNEDLEKLTVTSYFFWQGYHEGICDLGVMIPSFASDEGVLATEYYSQNIEFGNHDMLYERATTDATIPYLARIWQSGYGVMRTTNIVLNFLDENGAFNDSFVGWEDRLKGENYFCRAFAFYTLVKTFAQPYDVNGDMSVPAIICETENSEGAFDTKPLRSIEYVYDQIISDLKNAIEYLPSTYDATRDPIAYQDRAKKDAAHFLLARVYFQMGSEYWEKSLEQINLVLANNKYPLPSSPKATFTQRGLNKFTSETVFKYAAYDKGSAWRIPSMFYLFGGPEATSRKRMFSMGSEFKKYLGWDDAVEREKDLRYKEVFFNDKEVVWGDKWQTKGDDLPMMRSAELYLTRALINLKKGDVAQAIVDINVVTKRAYGDNHLPLAEGDYTTDEQKGELLELLNQERAKELFFEGDRLFYLQALRADIGPGDREITDVLPWNSDKLYWPIPEREHNLNDNIE